MMNERAKFSLQSGQGSRVSREDFELACVREFSHSGQHLGPGVSRGERCERIRATIFQEKKADVRWQDTEFSYAEMYAQAYQQPLEKRDSCAPTRLSKWRADMSDDDADI